MPLPLGFIPPCLNALKRHADRARVILVLGIFDQPFQSLHRSRCDSANALLILFVKGRLNFFIVRKVARNDAP